MCIPRDFKKQPNVIVTIEGTCNRLGVCDETGLSCENLSLAEFQYLAPILLSFPVYEFSGFTVLENRSEVWQKERHHHCISSGVETKGRKACKQILWYIQRVDLIK